MSKHLTPTDVALRLFGGAKGVGLVIASHEKTPLAWKRGSQWREPGDIPSTRIMRLLLASAKFRGIPLTAEHLIYGASEAEMAALSGQKEAA